MDTTHHYVYDNTQQETVSLSRRVSPRLKYGREIGDTDRKATLPPHPRPSPCPCLLPTAYLCLVGAAAVRPLLCSYRGDAASLPNLSFVHAIATAAPRRLIMSVSPSACACCRASSLVSGAAAATRFAATAYPSGDRATHSAASSAVAKKPRYTFLPPRRTCAW